MNRIGTICIAAVAAGAFVTAGIALQGGQELDAGNTPVASQPTQTPISLVEAHPFRLLEPATHFYRAEAPSYDSGYLVVLATAPEALVPRQVAEPVLYLGDETVERVNVGHESGYLVGIVPNVDGSLDLTADPVFFGAPTLPESIDAAGARTELEAALAAGVRAAGADEVERVLGELVEVLDHQELLTTASFLVEQYSPEEVDLIGGLRVERIGR